MPEETSNFGEVFLAPGSGQLAEMNSGFPVDHAIHHPQPLRIPVYGPPVSLEPFAFMHFLTFYLDYRGLRQSILWVLNSGGLSQVQYGSVVVQRIRRGVECYAKVMNLVMRSETDALFQIRVMGWHTEWGWREPTGELFSFIIAPLSRCSAELFDHAWGYFTCPNPLHQYATQTILLVRAYLSGQPNIKLPGNNWMFGWVLYLHLVNPACRALGDHLSTSLTVTTDDFNAPEHAYQV